jgi:hypothetical protein
MVWEKLKEYIFIILLWLVAASALVLATLYILVDVYYWNVYSSLFTTIIW